MVEKPIETPALEPLTTEKPSRTGDSGTFPLVKAAWSGSLIVKIVAIALAVLLLLFFILMIAFASSKSSCSTDLDNEKKASAGLRNDVVKLKADVKQAQSDLAAEKEVSRKLRLDIEGLNKQIVQLKADITTKDTQITQLQADLKKMTEEKEELQRKVTELNQQLQQKDQEIEQIKQEVTKRDHTITTLKAEITKYTYYLIGSVALHVAQLIHEIWVHVILATANKNIANLSSTITNLQGEIKNQKDMIKRLNDELEVLKQEINQLTEQIRTLNSELAHEKMNVEELKREINRIKKQIDIIPSLAVDQGILQLLLAETNYTFASTMVYNGTEHGYHKTEFLNRVGTRRPTIVIMKTKTGYVFGGGLNISWAQNGGFQTDPAAFTFSSTFSKVCSIITPSQAVNFDDNKFLEFGDNEITIEKSDSKTTTGIAEADRTYRCNAPDHYAFYNDGQSLALQDMWVYHVQLTKRPS